MPDSLLRSAARTVVLTSMLASLVAPRARAQETTSNTRVVVKSQHVRLPFERDVRRIAVGDGDILSAELITAREVLILGRDTGRTTLIVWFADGTISQQLVLVQQDLTVLSQALQRLDPSIEVESAPDRAALVLTGLVPTLAISQAAEDIARNYLDAGATGRSSARPIVAATSPSAPPVQVPPPDGVMPAAPQAVPATQRTPQPDAVQVQGPIAPPSGSIINLIRLQELPATPEEKVAAAIQTIGGQHVTVRRMIRGSLRDDARDTLVLEGTVTSQVALVRIMTLASQMFAGQAITAEDIRVIADEAGALTEAEQDPSQGTRAGLGNIGGGNQLFGGGNRGARLGNQVRRNLGRATAVEAAGGRVLSFIQVADLPQVRVDIRLLEVNRTKLRNFRPSSAVLLSRSGQPSLNSALSAPAVQGPAAARVGGDTTDVQNVLSFLGGTLLNQVQFSGGRAAVDAAISMLEREGIARSLSSPVLTVLSGELAQVQVGGEVPIPVAFAPIFSTTGGTAAAGTTGVFSSVDFIPFGVQLGIRPLVGDDDVITLDVMPVVINPDATLTNAIRESTGAAVASTAFQTRALRTSSRLQDGQALVVAGLLSETSSSNVSSAPGLRQAPLLGRLFQDTDRSENATDLVIVVNPALVRAPVADAALWVFPTRDELLGSALGARQTSPAP